mmetsp:Transcript_101872/g.197151  ORF Transcript_101872/g.197151 Transcript_101872/m.197151 type:complete len:83 (+) Transcript_101872:126-374(+)
MPGGMGCAGKAELGGLGGLGQPCNLGGMRSSEYSVCVVHQPPAPQPSTRKPCPKKEPDAGAATRLFGTVVAAGSASTAMTVS